MIARREQPMPGLAPIKGFQPESLLDWPGRIAAIVFLPRCNFRCPFCHAGALVDTPEKLPDVPFEQISSFLRARKGWIDGVVITGGEPTLWTNRLKALITAIKALGLGVKLDTNGSNPELLAEILREGLVDMVSMDIKAPLQEEAYARAAGVSVNLDALRHSIALLRESAVDVEFRTTVTPEILSIEDIAETARAIQGDDTCYFLQAFRPVEECLDEAMRSKERTTDAFMEIAARAAARWTPRVKVRGRFDFDPLSPPDKQELATQSRPAYPRTEENQVM